MHLSKELLEDLIQDKRFWDPQELYNHISRTNTFWSWGVSHKSNIQNKGLCLVVNGNHFQGAVIITLAGNDTFTIYYIQKKIVKDSIENIYIDQLLDVIDKKIEFIDSYTN